MPTSFKALQRTKVDDIFIGLAKLGLVIGLGYGMGEMTTHNLQESGTQVEYRRKEEEVTEAQKRRELRKAMREADRKKAARMKVREAKESAYRAKWGKLKRQMERDSVNVFFVTR